MKPLRISFWLLISFWSQFYWLAMSNTCVNPIIYYWMNARCCLKTKLNFHLLFQSKVSGLLWQGPFWLPATLALGPEETKNLWGAYWHCKDIYRTPQNILTTPSPFYNSHILDLFVSCDVAPLWWIGQGCPQLATRGVMHFLSSRNLKWQKSKPMCIVQHFWRIRILAWRSL